MFPELTPADAALGLVLRRDTSNAVARVNNHDLYWIEQRGDWNRDELLSTNLAQRYYRKLFNLTSYATIEAEPMYASVGGRSGSGWLLWANGFVATNITVTQPGTYLFDVLASGTPAFGGWPIMPLRINGRPVDNVVVPTNQPAWYTLSSDLSAGTHQLAISFDNDAYNPPYEDRNLFLDKIRWGREPDSSAATLLARPGVVAQVRHGPGLVLPDEVAWETETKNLTKAGRFISRLLTDLGAAFRARPALTIEA